MKFDRKTLRLQNKINIKKIQKIKAKHYFFEFLNFYRNIFREDREHLYPEHLGHHSIILKRKKFN